jgi:hypothetical protein
MIADHLVASIPVWIISQSLRPSITVVSAITPLVMERAQRCSTVMNLAWRPGFTVVS